MSGQISSSESEETSFIQTEQERILKSSNIFKQKEQCNNICAKHPNKKAKYYVQSDNSRLFCSKCALNLALKGLKIEETLEKQPEIYRQQRIQRFQEQLSEVLKQCSNKLFQLRNIEMNSSKQLMEQKENCQKFFESVINTANQLKLTYLSKFETDHITQLNQITEKISLVQQIDTQLKQYEIDISKNHENIVKHMEMKPFEDIMNRYEKRVSQTKEQLQEFNQEYFQKSIKFENNQILADMNKMCYNLLLKSEDSSEQAPKQIKLETSPKILQKTTNSPVDMKVFELLEGEDIYQSTCSNPIKDHIQSPVKISTQLQQQQKSKVNTYSNPGSTIQNSRRESNANTPESWQFKACLDRKNHQVTPNDRESFKHNISVGDQTSNVQYLNNQFELNERHFNQQNEKQKTIIEGERLDEKSNQLLINNINQLYIQKQTKDTERKSVEDREFTPKHQKNLTTAIPQTFKLLTNHASQKSQYQYPLVNNNLLEQKSQKEFSKTNYDSQPQQKSLTPLHQEPQSRMNNQQNHKQDNRRSNSKQPKQPSLDQIDGKRQFILANMNIQQQYTSQPTASEDTLKDRILKELCSHPGESVYNQVLKLNCQQKLKNQKQISKENFEQSTTVRMKNANGYLCIKKQSYQQ
ncbi:unnamed protein product (macronuclear) [Paramecium tetraurelia]|uniref:Uncharacterized protein n=1 Tax=Paramecium tetraurelia TaxID=5888 RepID=A0CKY6_PARTE|nr:uncharacterized protein GSPATT00008000001 [Paramecium tetraurelia]CAK71453.1 unnamed protein product [Paramecium tetraurelia]|eukprot:XP_001438850.1 hypothetical protein (macronuclear) [Paramecium tetraurelia strain d4-2]